MNVYDFDRTIYRSDSSIDFFLYCLIKHPRLLVYAPYQIIGFILYGLKKIDKTKLKEYYFSFLKGLTSCDDDVESFWKKNDRKIAAWYLKQKTQNDVIISASPEFLLIPVCRKIGVRHLIGSIVDSRNGHFYRPNCHGKEKVNRFREEFPEECIDEFYTDSKSDEPMMINAATAYLVKNGRGIERWKGEKSKRQS